MLPAPAAAPAFLLLCHLWPSATVTVAHEKWVRRRKGPELSDLFTMDTPHDYNRRANKAISELLLAKQLPAKVSDTFYDPYHHQGDNIFLRTTPAPDTFTNIFLTKNIDMKFYNEADIVKFRECNLVCPELYKRFGKACGWRWEKDKEWSLGWSGWQGQSNSYIYETFPNLCALQTANCMDHRVPKVSDKVTLPLWRLVHLGPCPEHDESLELIWQGKFNEGKHVSYWWDLSMDFLKISAENNYPTVTTMPTTYNLPL